METGYFLFVVRFRTVRRVHLAAGAAFFVALRRRRFLAGAFVALAFFVALRRFFAGARFFAALRFLAGAFFAARFLVARFLVAFFAVVFRFAVDFRLAGAFRFAVLRLAGAFLAARLFVAFFAFSESSHSGKFELRVTRYVGEQPTPYAIRNCSRASSARTPR